MTTPMAATNSSARMFAFFDAARSGMPPSKTHPDHGRQWTERRLLSALKRILKKLKLEGKLHTFRHSFISHALLNNTAVAVVKQWVGHVDPHVIDLYTHVHDAAS